MNPSESHDPSPARRCDVLVIGGGPGGSTVGALLAQAGREVGIELNGAVDNPLVLIEDGEILSTPNFHTPAIALAMCDALRAHQRATGRRAGLKLSGGIRSASAALGYLALVKESLGDEWLQPARLRFGASRLLDQLAASA